MKSQNEDHDYYRTFSYNLPKFCSNVSWNLNAITFTNISTVGAYPTAIFINTNNTIYVANRANNKIQIWFNNSIAPTQTIYGGLSQPYSFFVTTNGDIYVDNGALNHRVDKWTSNGNASVPVMNVNTSCYGLFVDTTDTLYCSMYNFHQVVKRWLNDNSSTLTTAAGTGTAGNTSSMLHNPCGIYVNANFDLYVADYFNNRIQLFQSGQLNAITVAGTGSLNTTIALNEPTGIVLDADSYLFIADYLNNRIVGSDLNGFRCLVGCSGLSGSASNQLLCPASLGFDSYGNMFVSDLGNSRIQKFILSTNSCNEITSTVNPTTTENPKVQITSTQKVNSTEQLTTSKTLITNQTCFSPRITLIPSTSTLSSPIQFRRSQDFYIVSLIELNCNNLISIITHWTIKNCTSIFSNQIQLDSTIITTSTELYIPARTLVYGLYELKLIVTMVNMSSLTSTSSVYVQITPSGITANLIQYGTSMITRGSQQDLQFDPGTYSIDRDNNVLNATNWIYEYYCRIYGLYMFPNLQGSLLSIEDLRNDSSNPSCLSNRTGWKFSNSIKSSLTILSGSLQSNRTYQFMVYMENRRNSSLQATGYVLVKVEDTHPQMILISCVIWTLCIPNLEFQLLNPTTQVALFSICTGNCTIIQNITWNIYYGTMNSSSNYTKWILFNQTSSYENIWFFGMNTSNFTTTNQLFLSNPQINLWRFEVIYTFPSEISSSSLNFIINQPPVNGSCSITPLRGTTSSLFDISCPNWFDEDDIKDYSIYSWTNNLSEQTIIAYSLVSTFQVRLPLGDDQTSLVHLTVYIRDTLDCITKFNLSSVTVTSDSIGITSLLNDIQNSPNQLTTNPIIQLLASGNQNIIGQVITSISQQFNRMNNKNIDQAISNGVPSTSISISSLEDQNIQGSSILLNKSALIEFNNKLNMYANTREYLMQFITKLVITNSYSIQLQSSLLAQLTKATNQLTRTTLKSVSDKCYQLAIMLNSIKTNIPYEDVQSAATQLIQCAANPLSAVNGPLQQRISILDSDSTQATTFPSDCDTDLDFAWSNLNLFADGNDFSWGTIQKNRNIYYQKQLANQITNQMNDLKSLLTSSLNIYLNIGQNILINTSQVFMSLETKTNEFLSNKFPQSLNLTNNSKISIRSLIEPLASYDNTTYTNLSRLVTFSILDENENEVSIQTNMSHPIEIIIPRDPNIIIPPMILQNVTSMNSTPHNQLFDLHYLNITSSLSISIHFEIQSLNISLAYLFIYKFDQLPQLNTSINSIDGWTLFCPLNLSNETLYKYFIDNQQTFDHQSIIYGLRELNSTEMINTCSNTSINSAVIILIKNNQWKSDGLTVGPLTNHYETQCFSTHLTSFAGGFIILSESINWNYVFANADFMKNKTIYLTVNCVSVIYIILIMYARFKDKKDIEKLGVTPLPDNHQSDQYFYQIIVFTGQRQNAGTNSNVHFIVYGDNDETHIRTLADSQRKILQRVGIDSFIMAVPEPLGLLNCIHIWHDNTGKGSSSWFLQYIIIRDLQTMEKLYFICQRWFAVEKIKRILFVAGEAYHSVSDGHLWFSIFSRPLSNQFTRVQRCTCCFVLFFISMFLNIMYYDLSAAAKTNNSTNTASLSFGSFYLNSQQVIIGIVVELFALISSLLLVQLFRRLQSRKKQISPLHQTLYKIRPDLNINEEKIKKKFSLSFPWWCIFIAYGLCIILVGLSIFLTQPLKIIGLTIFFAFFCQNSYDDKEANEYLNNHEEYLHLVKKKSLFTYRQPIRVNRLNESEINSARNERLKELLLYLCFITVLYIIIYSNRDLNSFLQVNHSRKFFFNSRQINCDYTKITTIYDYWNWSENNFITNIRAQQWYNNDPPRNLSGFINDKSNRLIGWATMRQLRVKSILCQVQNEITSTCQYDYNFHNEDKYSYKPGWKNSIIQNYSSSISQSFQYSTVKI
ncbi:unnamed protein product [Adineta steineri]|uniref:PLAT domain-containing protein n=1 Tax=Adineta steineri TaxID=433720 RepID=A0A819S7J4_9BILA|nr:unnamed protein product [Adineta steineri]